MREKLSLGLWILTIILMTASVTDEFVRQQSLSVVSLVFVLTLALSAIGLSVVDWAGKDSGLSRLWHSRAFSIATFVVTLVVILAIGPRR